MKQKQIFTFRDAEKQVAPAAFSIMLKPAGSACNLDCHYCYYLDKAVQYGGRQAVMDDQLLELCIKQYIRANEVDTVQFCWHASRCCWDWISTAGRWSCSAGTPTANGSRTRCRPTVRWSTRRGATFSQPTIFWSASRSTGPGISTTPSA